MNEQIKSNLALEIAEKSLGLAILKAEKEVLVEETTYLRARVNELEVLLDEQTKPAKEGEN